MNGLRTFAVGKVCPDIGTVIVTEQDALGTLSWPEFITGINAAIAGASLEDMQTADEVAGWWYANKRNGVKPLTDKECAAELEALRDGVEDEDFWRGHC